MVALAGQRAQFTWARNEYNKTDDPAVRAKYVRGMAAAIRNSVGAGFTKDEVTRDKSYPADEVDAAAELSTRRLSRLYQKRKPNRLFSIPLIWRQRGE